MRRVAKAYQQLIKLSLLRLVGRVVKVYFINNSLQIQLHVTICPAGVVMPTGKLEGSPIGSPSVKHVCHHLMTLDAAADWMRFGRPEKYAPNGTYDNKVLTLTFLKDLSTGAKGNVLADSRS